MPEPAMRKRHKYGAKPCVIEGIRFASQKEGARYQELRLLEKAGEIHELDVQPRYPLEALSLTGNRSRPLGEYWGDFVYCECDRGERCVQSRLVVEDVKGYDTPLSKWKRRHVEAQYGIRVVIV